MYCVKIKLEFIGVLVTDDKEILNCEKYCRRQWMWAHFVGVVGLSIGRNGLIKVFVWVVGLSAWQPGGTNGVHVLSMFAPFALKI